MAEIVYGGRDDVTPEELTAFYTAVGHEIAAQPAQIRKMLENSAVFVTARAEGQLIGIARGVGDGLRGYLTECKLDPTWQGPAAITRKDGRIEHDTSGIARELARRVLRTLQEEGAQRIDVVAWNTEVDFLEELGFKRRGGYVGMTIQADELEQAVAGQLSTARD